MTGPYASAAAAYWQAGWRGIVPLPARAKKNPPSGFTGSTGVDPSYADLDAWATGPEGSGNIALRMPRDVIGIDVDAYGDKLGRQTLEAAELTHGALPDTWRTTSRDDGVSGIRLYRVPEGLAWPGEIGPSTELIQHRHRYALVWPSIHPEGRTYRWINPDGIVSATIPDVDELPWLPDAWVQAYTGRQLAETFARNNHTAMTVARWMLELPHAQDPMCSRMENAITQMVEALPGSAHNAARDMAMRCLRLAEEGHHGLLAALEEGRRMFVKDATNPDRGYLGKTRRTEPEAGGEWADVVTSAGNFITANPSGVSTCDCYGQITNLLTGPAPAATNGSLALAAPTPAKAEVSPDPADGGDDTPKRLKDGATFILDAPVDVPAVWGFGDDVLWAVGEALMIVGPPGVGKTTLTTQVVRGLLGLEAAVLGYGVSPSSGRILYLAMDRPAQIARAMRRSFTEDERDILADRLRVWEGPPPGDIARHTDLLVTLAHLAGATTIIVDSLKDAAVGLTEDEIGAGYNRARQTALANGIQVLELHHLVKRGPNGSKPNTLADVYGSAWLTAGAGSVLLLWGSAGDPLIEATHLKQPASEVGPLRVLHDHQAGRSSVIGGGDLVEIVAGFGPSGVGARDIARALYQTDDPSKSEVEKARGKLKRMAAKGDLEVVDDGEFTRWKAANVDANAHQSTGFIHSPSVGYVGANVGALTSTNTQNVGDVGAPLHPPPTPSPPLKGDGRGEALAKPLENIVERTVAGERHLVNLTTGEVVG
ncbi:MAG TPA: bifunctional DNA primase/polymerase [Streptomyces sp.]